MCRKSICLASLIMVLGLAGYVFANDADTEIPDTRGNKPVLDGVVDDIWSLSAENIMTMSREGTAPDSAADCSGSWWALWDWDYLYILVDVNDEELVQDSGEAEGWNDDRVEIFIDGDNSKDAVFWGGGVNDYQYCFRWNNGEVETPVEMYFSDSGIDKLEGVEYAVATTEHGYLVEIALPWSTLIDEPPLPGQLIGIEVMIDDDDDGGGRDTQFSWYIEEAGAPHYPSLWGTAMLTAIPAPEPVNPGAEGLVAHWPLDEGAGNTAADIVGGHDGTLKSGVAWAGEGSPANGDALSFDGYSDGVSHATDPGTINWVSVDPFDVVGPGITLAAWIRPDGFDIGDARIITKQKTWSSSDIWWMLSTYTDGTALRMRLKTNDGGADNGTTTMFSDTGYLEAGVWSHVAATYDGSKMRLYHNAVEIMSTDKTGTIQTDPTVAVAIGNSPLGDPGGLRATFHGLIDDARIYERALSEGEVLYLAGKRAMPVDPGSDGLVAFYALENDVLDGSGNGNDGTIVGAPTFVDGPTGYGMSMEFDGESYVDCGNDASLDITGPISMGIWIRPGTDGSVETAPLCKADASAGWSWQLRYGWGSGGKPTIMGFQFNATGGSVWIFVNQDLAIGEWYHIAASHDGATVKCYLDGVETDSAPMTDFASGPSSLLIGSDGWRSDWIGAIDEVIIYNRALSEGEVMYLAGKRVTPVDVTAPGDAILGVPNDGLMDGDNFGWPGAETPDLAIDDDTSTKFLHFKGELEPTGFQVTPTAGPSIVTGLTFTTANDAEPRDPVTFELSGSNESIDGPYELIASGDIVDFAQADAWPRFTMNATPISFDNDVAYAHYQVLFPAVRDAASANSMQIAEVELLGELTPAGPVGHWKLDDGSGTTAYDSSGNGLDGTLNGDPQWVTGQLGGALDFDGDDSVEIPHNPLLSITDEITITAWTYMRANASGEMAIVSKGGWAANDLPYELTETPGSVIFWQFYDDEGRDTCAPQSPPVDEWHHIAATYDGNIFKCYIDGVLADEWGYAGTMPENTASVTIGQRSRGGTYFNGMIDEVRIYDVALTAEEVAALAQ